jgi:hypothetical protein
MHILRGSKVICKENGGELDRKEDMKSVFPWFIQFIKSLELLEKGDTVWIAIMDCFLLTWLVIQTLKNTY